MKRVLVVSMTKFYGGGENFITTHLNSIDGIDFFYLVSCKHLAGELPNDKVIFNSNNSFLAMIRRIKFLVKERHIDIVLLNGGRSLFLAPFIHRNSTCAGIRHTLNSSVNSPAIYRGIYISLLNVCYCFMKTVIHVSKKSQSEQLLAKRKSSVIYNGVSEKEKKYMGNGKNFAFIGRMAREKGVDVLIAAFNRICEQDNDVHLYLVGSGEIDSSFPHHDNIHFEGFHTDLEQYYRMSNWYISLTTRENCSISALEAFSYGLPVITTDVGGNIELVETGTNGFIIEPSDCAVRNLYETTVSRISDEEYRRLSENAFRIFSMRFNLEKQKKQYKILLEGL